MRIFFVSDLHVDVPGNAGIVDALAAQCEQDAPDVVIVAGDVCNGTARLAAMLGRFAGATRIYVPGNHELWARTPDEPSARDRYYAEIPRIARAAGFHPLVREPIVTGDVAFVGTMGWYDYSFASDEDGFSPEELATKAYDGLEWMDRRFVRWTDGDGRPLPDPEVSDLMVEDLADQIESLANTSVRTIVLVTHHLPFASLCPPVFVDGRLRYFRAFLGSRRLGEAAAREPRIRLALAGHVHSVRSTTVGGILARTCPVGYPRERRDGEPPPDRRLLIEV